ncbi:ThuA domain-containing protein [Oligosphaera ethanolica]|uniref:Type 1 glutamine amidotransferase/HEAT repeat protein n=1 Tax=Oligosphaera ethanolica TaxID=760260 RepID=A0AAE3VGF8_9BACT|nr:ThuA domain-containing protein [Oligosphaera ethanolica]MDQ0289985.1 type 1 glutamine amidotransferase/HEAT repeat protein [Oligosphaera ethanolica]
MKHSLRIFSCVAALAAAATLCAQDNRPQPTEADIARMRAAMPANLYVKPAQPRKVLIYCETETFYHTSIPFANQALTILGEHSGAFTVTSVSTDPAVFEPENLKQFDVIVLNNNTGREPLGNVDPETLPEGPQRQAAQQRELRLRNGLLDFARNGKGVLAIHAAIDAFYKWPEYGDLLGGYFNLHPWSESVGAELVDPGHPLLRAYRGRNFRINEEIYQVKEPYSRDRQRVLMRLDTANTNMNKGDQIRRDDGDFALAWLKRYGEGRVFYLSFGHRHDTFWDPATLQVLLDAMQYCAGDVVCDDRPSSQLDDAYYQQSAATGRNRGLDAIFADLSQYRDGAADRPLRQVEALVNEAMDPAKRSDARDLATRLAALLRPASSSDLRCIALRQLSRIGGDSEIPAIASQINAAGDDEHGSCSTMALYALQRLPGAIADQALIAALPKAGAQSAAVAAVLGYRQTRAAVPAISKLLTEPEHAAAAAAALGQIGGSDAARALIAALAPSAAPLPVLLGLIELIDSISGDEQAAVAQAVLDHPAATPSLRGSAIIGLSQARGNAALPVIHNALRSDDLRLQRAAAEALVDLPEALATSAAQLNDLPPGAAALVIGAIAKARATALEDLVIQAMSHDNDDISNAAIDAVAACGSAKAVRPLADLASNGDAKQNRARRSLAFLNAAGVDDAIRTLAADNSLPEKVRAELFGAMGSRIDRASIAMLLQAAKDDNKAIRKEAIAALAIVANVSDSTALIDLIAAVDSAADRTRLEGILVAVNRRAADPAATPALLAAALGKNPPAPTRIAFLNAMGKLAHADSLPLIITDTRSDDAGVKRAAILALCDWPDTTPLANLQTLSRDQQASLAHRVLALRGYARMLAMPSKRPMRDTLAMYREAFDLVQGPQEKQSLLKGLGDLIHPDAMKMALDFRKDPDLSNEAVIAATKIMNGLSGASMKLKASHGTNSLKNALDSNRATRWTSGTHQKGDEWLEIDLGYETAIESIFLDAGDTGQDYPTEFRVFASLLPEGDWGQPVASGKGTEKQLTIKPTNAYGRYIRIEQTAQRNYFWSITRLQVNGVPEFAASSNLDRSAWKLSADKNPGALAKAIDGDTNSRWDSAGPQRPGCWFAIDLGAEYQLRSITLNATRSANDFPRGFRVDVSTDGKNWDGPVGMGHGENAITTIPLLPNKARMLKITLTDAVDPYYWSIHEIDVTGRQE